MPENSNQNLFDKRIFRMKNPSLEFYCPLCRQKRYMKFRSRPSKKNYTQLLVASLFIIFIAFPYVKQKSWDYTFIIIFILIMWACYEMIIKIFYRKELPCPHCGFDMTWYRRDVRIAKKLVKDFWHNKNQQTSPATSVASVNSSTLPASSTAFENLENPNSNERRKGLRI
ncbi:MAG: hypothetical protein HQK51_15135 [Oligoflexia bacterium]|nr:hypothetical protein [Oligoflexia bacterium]